MTEPLIQYQKVTFNIDGVVKGTGKIVGIGTSDQPIIGRSYIIEPDTPISSEIYPYSHFVAFEIHLTKI